MIFKALKSFVSGFGTFDADKEYDEKLDKPTQKMWIEHGLIEKVEAAPVGQPDQEGAPDTAPTEEEKSVTADENQ